MVETNLALLWDMDGTIFDSHACHLLTWQTALKKFGYEVDQEVYNKNFGRNTRAFLPLLLGFNPSEALYDKIVNEKEANFRQLAPIKTSLVPGVETWLADAQHAGFKQVIASSAPMANIDVLISSFHLGHYFEGFIPGSDLPAKPEPDVFLKAANYLGVTPSRCIVIEDSLAGVKAAKNAGMFCIAVSTTYRPAELKIADYIIEDFSPSMFKILHVLGFDDSSAS